ncbi:hypothetical protein PHSY_003627 [Pseudozyma hubeiensis SY62]|uniref:Uncharacterized protein n=1 Tax=Pseudozyma hubeiensis (strain SY62) TaxID=1305764 RepID=R9P3L6_PSEHS|nr:hypothetical protein PHSY_003627 [Pseudozyma hubeiensis SY62]GAC96048.1 hypothetical protein PHSY_003627 [Pseudozyma hubeiensis SY62]
MFHSAPSPGRSGPSSSSSYGFATPVRTPSTSYHAYSQALTPADASAKAVRFQNQPLPPQTQQQTQSSALNSAATPNKSPYQAALSTSTQPQPPQQQQLTQRNAVASSAAAPAAGSGNGNKMTVTRSVAAAGGAESTIALKRRIKWNLSALGLLWIVPAVSTRPRDAYWLVLDQIYMHVGGDTDELVDGIVGWIMWAVSVVLLFNAVEAAVLVQRASSSSSPAPAQSTLTTTTSAALPAHGKQPQTPVLGMHSPSIAKSINFVAASRLKGSPKTRTSDIGAGSPISRSSPKASPKQDSPNTTVDYSQFSPANRRASSPISTPNSFGSASRAGTPTMTEYGRGLVGSGNVSGSSPLAAFRARHVSRGSSSPARARSITPSVSGSGLSELSFDASDSLGGGAGGQEEEETFLGDESFEVDRALKSLRGSLGGVSSTPAPGFR